MEGVEAGAPRRVSLRPQYPTASRDPQPFFVRAIAACDTETAAQIQATARVLVSVAQVPEVAPRSPAEPGFKSAAQPSGGVAFINQLQRRTTGALSRNPR